MYGLVFYNVVHCCIVRFSVVWCGAVLYVVKFCADLYSVMYCEGVLYDVMQRCKVWCSVVYIKKYML